ALPWPVSECSKAPPGLPPPSQHCPDLTQCVRLRSWRGPIHHYQAGGGVCLHVEYVLTIAYIFLSWLLAPREIAAPKNQESRSTGYAVRDSCWRGTGSSGG